MNGVRRRTDPQDWLALLGIPLAVSAAAEALAGAFVSGAAVDTYQPYLLCLSSFLLFAAASLFSHYFDRWEDEERNPDRPLPSGRVAVQAAWRAGLALLVAGAALPALVGRGAVLAAIVTALAIVLYAAVTRGAWGASFLTLGFARAANFALGLSNADTGLPVYWSAALTVGLFATGWAVYRAARQPGAPPSTGFVALLHVVAAASLLFYQAVNRFYYRVDALPFLLALLAMTLPRFVRAVLDPRRPFLSEAVQYGFLGLTLLEASLAAGYAGIRAGVLVVLLAVPLYAALRRWPVSLITTPR